MACRCQQAQAASPERSGKPMCPSTALLRIEFTAPTCLHAAGELLPRLSTLTSSEQVPYPSLRRVRQSSLISLLLLFVSQPLRWVVPRFWSDGAVYLCCTCPRVTPGGRYPLSLPYGARTFLTQSLSASARGRSAYSQQRFY